MNPPGLARKAPSVLLGDLLVKSRLIHMKDLADAIPISMKTGLPIGRILIGSGAIKESTMQAVLFAQSLVRDRLLDEQLAVESIKEVDSKSCSLDDALAKLGWKKEAYEMTNRLGEIFLEAGIISKEQLDAALEAFFSTGLPLARVLVLQGVITAPMAFTALRAQKLIRDEIVTRQQATDALWLTHHNGTQLEESLNYHGYSGPEQSNSIRIGELLILANAINEIDVLEGVERSINNSRLIGEMLVADGKLPQYLLNAALELQRMSTTGELEPASAGEALRRIYATGMTVEEAVKELTASVSLRTELLSLQPYLAGNVEEPKPENELHGLVPVEQAAQSMGISVKVATKRIKKGLLSGVKQNGKWFVWFPEEISTGDESQNACNQLDEAAANGSADPFENADKDIDSSDLQKQSSIPMEPNEEPDTSVHSDSHEDPHTDIHGDSHAEPDTSIHADSHDQRGIEAQSVPYEQQSSTPGSDAYYEGQSDPFDQWPPETQQDPFESLDPAAQSAQFEDSDNINNVPESILDAVHTISWLDTDSFEEGSSSHVFTDNPQRNAAKEFRLLSDKRERGRSKVIRTKKTVHLSPQDIKDMLSQHLQLIEKLSTKLEELSYRTGFVEGKLAAYEEIAASKLQEDQ